MTRLARPAGPDEDVPDKTFMILFTDGVELLDLSFEQMAQEFSVSRPIAIKWMTGDICPAQSYRRLVLRTMYFLAEKAVKELKTGQEVEP